MSYRGIARGNVIELDEPLPYPDGQTLVVEVEPGDKSEEAGSVAAILRAVNSPPFVSSEDVDELERVINETKLPPGKAFEF